MEIPTRDALLTLLSGVLFFGGIALILFGDFVLAAVGIVAITLGAVVFVVDGKDFLEQTGRSRQ